MLRTDANPLACEPDIASGGLQLEINSEPALVAAAARGNRQAYEQLVRKYQDRLMITVGRVVRDRSDAEDVCQEAFLRAFVHLPTFTGRSAFFTWLCRIALNVAIGEHRRRARAPFRELQADTARQEPIDRGDLPGDRLMRRESVSRIQQALAALPPDQRAVLMLRAVNGLNYHEISRRLDLNIGTVRSRLHRARQELRDLLQDPRWS
jgi:RNA polymerase sigma-70 factor, ECF subfamily